MSDIRIADLIDKDLAGIRGDVRGGRYDWAEPLVRTLVKCERRTERRMGSKVKEPWIYLYWIPEPRKDGMTDCGYSGWQEEHFRELDPVVADVIETERKIA